MGPLEEPRFAYAAGGVSTTSHPPFAADGKSSPIQEGECAAKPNQRKRDDKYRTDDYGEAAQRHQYDEMQQVAVLAYTRIRIPWPHVNGPLVTLKSAP